MANQLALMAHCNRGDSVVVPRGSHMVLFETGAAAAIAGVQLFEVGTDGLFDGDDVRSVYRGNAYISPPTRLVVVENTHNNAGGRVTRPDRWAHIVDGARGLGIPVHVDGARIGHAALASNVSPRELCAGAASASLCLSKALGAPAGSVLVGDAPFIERARRFRRMLGGGMRQVGILAAAGLYALDNHWAGLADDHRRASALAAGLRELASLQVEGGGAETNIVIVALPGPAAALVERLGHHGVRCMAFGERRVRFVFHREVSDGAVTGALAALQASVKDLGWR